MHWHTALITSTFTPRFTTTYLRTDITKPPLHFVSLQLIFAWRRKQMSRLKKMRLTTAYPRVAFTEGASQELPPHGLYVKTSRKKPARLHGVCINTAYPRTALITSLSRRSTAALANIYHRIASTTRLC